LNRITILKEYVQQLAIYNKDTMGFKIRFDIFVYIAPLGYPVNPIVPIECVESSFRSSEVMRFGLK